MRYVCVSQPSSPSTPRGPDLDDGGPRVNPGNASFQSAAMRLQRTPFIISIPWRNGSFVFLAVRNSASVTRAGSFDGTSIPVTKDWRGRARGKVIRTEFCVSIFLQRSLENLNIRRKKIEYKCWDVWLVIEIFHGSLDIDKKIHELIFFPCDCDYFIKNWSHSTFQMLDFF